MNIEDMGELKKFETMPTEGTLYLTAIQFQSGLWGSGPFGMDKQQVITYLSGWSGVVAARIYSVQVPLTSKGG